MKTVLIAAAIACLPVCAYAQDWNSYNLQMQARQQQMDLQQQMNNLQLQQQLQQHRIYDQSVQMRAGNCMYNAAYC
jgi:hypothetical protein